MFNLHLTHSLFQEAATSDCSDPDECAYWVEKFGAAAGWFLRPEVLRRAVGAPGRVQEHLLGGLKVFLERPFFDGDISGEIAREGRSHLAKSAAPLLSSGEGACAVLFVREESGVVKAGPSGALRDAFFVPLKWQRDCGDSRRLPEGLLELASGVRSELKANEERFGLHLDYGRAGAGLDLSRLTLRCESGWASLAAGLILARGRFRPRPEVFVSAAWGKKHGFRDVEGLEAKMAAAAAFGVRTFFASSGRDIEIPGVEFRRLSPGVEEPLEALRDVLHELRFKPTQEAGDLLKARCEYANGFPRNQRVKRQEYLMDEVTVELAAELPRDARAGRQAKEIKRLVVLMSAPPAAMLTLLAVRPAEALVVHSEREKEAFPDMCARLEKKGIVGVRGRLCDFEDADEVYEVVSGFIEGHSGAAVDVTGGSKGWTFAGSRAAIKTGARVLHIHSKGEHEAGSEDLVFLY